MSTAMKRIFLATLGVLSLASCGGGDSAGQAPAPTPAATEAPVTVTAIDASGIPLAGASQHRSRRQPRNATNG